MFSQSYPRLVKGLMGTFKVSGLNHLGVFGEIDQSSVNKLPFIPKRKLKKKDGVHSPEYLGGIPVEGHGKKGLPKEESFSVQSTSR